MTYMETAIWEAVKKGGYSPAFGGEDWSLGIGYVIVDDERCYPISDTFLDPAFWQALGRARGWGGHVNYTIDEHMKHESSLHIDGGWDVPTYQMIRLAEHLAEGKDAESFFATLI